MIKMHQATTKWLSRSGYHEVVFTKWFSRSGFHEVILHGLIDICVRILDVIYGYGKRIDRSSYGTVFIRIFP